MAASMTNVACALGSSEGSEIGEVDEKSGESHCVLETHIIKLLV
jgi:hypothetical protein